MLSDSIIFVTTIPIMGVLLVILVVNYFKYLIKSNGYVISPCLLVRSLAGFTYISFFFALGS